METGSNQSVEISQRQLRIIHAVMLLSIVFYAFMSLRAPLRPAPQPVVLYGVAAVCVADLGVILVLRSKLLPHPRPISSTEPDPRILIANWRRACIVTWAFSEAIALFGIVLRYMGFPMRQAALFFVAGFLLMLLFAPTRPEGLSDPS